MNPSYFRIKLPIDQAVQRLCGFEGKTPKETILCRPTQAVSHCIDEKKQWKGSCLFVYENKGWTVFEDLSGFYAGMPAKVGRNLHNRRISWRRDIMMRYCMVSWW